MEYLSVVVVLIFIALLLTIAWFIRKQDKQTEFPYSKNVYFMTPAEVDFYIVLQKVVPQQYLIFSQVSLNNLLLVDRKRKDYMQYFNKIRQKSVDFVLVEKSSMRTVLAIELDDRSHNYPDRIRRDEIVNAAFAAAGLPLLRITNQRSYDETALLHAIEGKIYGK